MAAANEVVSEEIKIAEEASSLFKLKRGNEEFFLLGTMHSVPLDTLPKPVVKHILSAKYLIKEKIPSEKGFFEILTEILKQFNGFDKENEYQKLNLKTRIDIEAFFSRHPVSKALIPHLNQYKPWITLALLSFLTGMDVLAKGMDTSIEEVFGQSAGHAIAGGLETDCDRIAMLGLPQFSLADIEKRIQEQLVIATKSHAQQIQEAKEVTAKYLKGDLVQALQDLRQQSKQDPRARSWINQRNHHWIKPLLAHIKDKQKCEVLVSVGRYHLLGDEGLLNLLAKEGFTIERCKNDGSFSGFNLKTVLDPVDLAASMPRSRRKW